MSGSQTMANKMDNHLSEQERRRLANLNEGYLNSLIEANRQNSPQPPEQHNLNLSDAMQELNRQFQSGQISLQEYNRQVAIINLSA